MRPATPIESNSAPVIVNTPPTPVTLTSPFFPAGSAKHGAAVGPTDGANDQPVVYNRPRGDSLSSRPSNLSHVTSLPLTPTPENVQGYNQQTGFFSTVISAAQNAANTLSNSISNSSLTTKEGRSRSETAPISQSLSGGDVEVESVASSLPSRSPSTIREPAIKTLGQGNLSLSHLGIADLPVDPSSSGPVSLSRTGAGGTSAPSSPQATADAANKRAATPTPDEGIALVQRSQTIGHAEQNALREDVFMARSRSASTLR